MWACSHHESPSACSTNFSKWHVANPIFTNPWELFCKLPWYTLHFDDTDSLELLRQIVQHKLHVGIVVKITQSLIDIVGKLQMKFLIEMWDAAKIYRWWMLQPIVRSGNSKILEKLWSIPSLTLELLRQIVQRKFATQRLIDIVSKLQMKFWKEMKIVKFFSSMNVAIHFEFWKYENF